MTELAAMPDAELAERVKLTAGLIDSAGIVGRKPLPVADELREAARRLAAPKGDVVIEVTEMHLSGGRCDYFVSFKCGDREVTPHCFRERFKAEYHVELYRWLFGQQTNEPDLLEFGPDDWPAKKAAPQAAPSADEREELAKVIASCGNADGMFSDHEIIEKVLAAGYRKRAAPDVAARHEAVNASIINAEARAAFAQELVAWCDGVPSGRLYYPHEIVTEIRKHLAALPKGQEDEV